MVGVGHGLLLCLECGQLLAVSFQHIRQHAERVAGPGRLIRVTRLAVRFAGETVIAGQFGGRARACAGSAIFAGSVNAQAVLVVVPRVRVT